MFRKLLCDRVVAVVVILLLSGGTHAGTFDANAIADLRLLSVTGDDLTGLYIHGLGDEDVTVGGAANADAGVRFEDDPLTIGTGVDTAASASVTGSGDAIADAEASASVEVFNGTVVDVEVTFQFDWQLEAMAALGGTIDDAVAEAFVDLFVDGILLTGADSVFDTVVSDALTGFTDSPSVGSTMFTLLLGPDDVAFVDFVVAVNGASSAARGAVAVPPVLGLLLAGVTGLLGMRRFSC